LDLRRGKKKRRKKTNSTTKGAICYENQALLSGRKRIKLGEVLEVLGRKEKTGVFPEDNFLGGQQGLCLSECKGLNFDKVGGGVGGSK